ncbi:NAD(P)H-binding protein [Pseudofrankia inefficax]|uniref:NmrA family protein n=1 Tax=Pseudofrankia inefficax (strain DSM 45817 / CECT 9037 / DDB 130130 / EuI1c) TaxID=298654 RepID=E3J953_PSEI1|nr:NAD(P)H-binding protein [Pseudofrankia inefficax]ADP80932.1 NmrA family protein [Pseudofrankia inefficax]
MILVTGATGTVGGEVLRLLSARGARVRAMTREPARLRLSEGAPIEGVRADFDHVDSLHRAIAGVDSVFLLTMPGPGGSVAERDRAMIGAARAGGVRKVVKLSAIGGNADDADDLPSPRHRAGEQALAASGLTWSALRPSAFASNTLSWAAAIRAGEPVPNLTGEGAQGVIDPRDVAAVAVEALLTDEHDGAAHTLTGPELLSVPDQVAQLATELRRAITTVDVPAPAVRRQLVSAGFDPSVADSAVDGYQLIRDGGNTVVTDDVERILGRPARTFRAWARDHRTAFVAGEGHP